MSRITSEKNTAEYDATDRSGVEILADGACNRNLLTIVGIGGDFTAGTVEVYVKGRGSRRYLAMKDAYGNAVSINLATADAVMIDKPIGSVRLNVSGISGATGWKAVLSGIDEPMSVNSSSVPGPVIVAGQSAVGLVPANPPVGVSGVDGSGLKRALLTDATGKLTTVTPDCLDVSGSVSSADVLFTVDMLNYQSITVHLTDAGTGCTIIWEASTDQNVWVGVSGVTVGPSATSNAFSTTVGTAGAYSIPKKLRWFRARVSVYGSGTVTAVGNALYGMTTSSVIATTLGSAEGSTVSGAPTTIGVEARDSSKASVASGRVVRPIATVDGRLVMRQHSIPENEWVYAAASGGIANTTTAVTIKASAGANVRNYITSLQIQAEALTNATEVAIRDGAGGTVLWRIKVPTTGLPLLNVDFADPLKATTNTLLEVVTLTASGTGAVYVNAQGYIAP